MSHCFFTVDAEFGVASQIACDKKHVISVQILLMLMNYDFFYMISGQGILELNIMRAKDLVPMDSNGNGRILIWHNVIVF